MRTSNSIKNGIMGAIANLINIVVAFLAQKIFINILGVEYLGINGLFTNILSFLAIAELGLGEAIIFNMYKPIAENDKEKIKSLMSFYKKAYRYIILTILIIGLILTPFINFFVGENTLDINIYLVYLLFLAQTVSSYLLTYKRSILYAFQKNYILNIIHIVYIIILNVSQILILYFTNNYFMYLIVKVICIILENIIINLYVNKKYTYLLEKNIIPLSKNDSDDIFSRIKAMFLHKIGSFIVNSTDNILISKMFGVLYVGLYSNYYMIINAVTSLFSQFISATTPSIGDLLVENDKEKTFKAFKKIRFLNFYISTFTGVCILLVIQPFIRLWLGENYLLSISLVFVLVINYYQKMMRKTYDSFMIAAGICRENKFVPIIESLFNIISSIILAKFFGLVGIFIGTIISGLILWCYSYPKFMYKKIFQRKYFDYAKETLSYFIIFLVIIFISYNLYYFINFHSLICELLGALLIAIFLSNILLVLVFYRNDNFKYFRKLFIKFFNKILKSPTSKC